MASFYFKIKYYRAAYKRLLYLLETYPETYVAQQAKASLEKYYQMALKETESFNKGEVKDFSEGVSLK